jgi:hypothetical protein
LKCTTTNSQRLARPKITAVETLPSGARVETMMVRGADGRHDLLAVRSQLFVLVEDVLRPGI